MDKAILADAIDQTLGGVADRSGKTPLDSVLERFDWTEPENRRGLAEFLTERYQSWAKEGAPHLRLGRQILRRTDLKHRSITQVLQRILDFQVVREDLDRRLTVLLTLMDLHHPPTVAALKRDTELRNERIGEWLTLIAANEDYNSVENAFVGAIEEGRVSPLQLQLKAELVRQHFGGAKLRQFLIACVDGIHSPEDRSALISTFHRMYGVDLSKYIGLGAKWWSAQTDNVLEGASAAAA